jgi:hypothetical protein
VGALGHYLEEEGVATTQLSLVREHTAAINPPRALWVPFMLGRPLGVPNDAAFQRRVLLAVLRLFERATGPVLEDFPEDAPHVDLGPAPEGLVCPVSFPRAARDGDLGEALADEVSQLQAWHDLAVRHRGRTTLGVTGLAPDGIAAFLASWLTDAPRPTYSAELPAADALKRACDELKAFYYEAKAVQPGRHSSALIQDWFWMETAAGRALLEIRNRAAGNPDPAIKALAAQSLVPRAVDASLESLRTRP